MKISFDKKDLNLNISFAEVAAVIILAVVIKLVCDAATPKEPLKEEMLIVVPFCFGVVHCIKWTWNHFRKVGEDA